MKCLMCSRKGQEVLYNTPTGPRLLCGRPKCLARYNNGEGPPYPPDSPRRSYVHEPLPNGEKVVSWGVR